MQSSRSGPWTASPLAWWTTRTYLNGRSLSWALQTHTSERLASKELRNVYHGAHVHQLCGGNSYLIFMSDVPPSCSAAREDSSMPGFPFRRSTHRSRQSAGSLQTCGIRTVSGSCVPIAQCERRPVKFSMRHLSLAPTAQGCDAVYKDGRVCISILHDPGDDPHGYETAAERWSPVQSVRFPDCPPGLSMQSTQYCATVSTARLELTSVCECTLICTKRCRWRRSWCRSFRCCRLRTTSRQPTSMQPKSGGRTRRLSGSTSGDAFERVRRCFDVAVQVRNSSGGFARRQHAVRGRDSTLRES